MSLARRWTPKLLKLSAPCMEVVNERQNWKVLWIKVSQKCSQFVFPRTATLQLKANYHVFMFSLPMHHQTFKSKSKMVTWQHHLSISPLISRRPLQWARCSCQLLEDDKWCESRLKWLETQERFPNGKYQIEKYNRRMHLSTLITLRQSSVLSNTVLLTAVTAYWED